MALDQPQPAPSGFAVSILHAKMSRATFRRLASPVRKRLEGPPRRSIDNRRDLIVPMPEPFRGDMLVIPGFNRQLLINASIVLIFAALCANI